MIMKQKKQFKELSDEELSQVTGGTNRFRSRGDCTSAGGVVDSCYPNVGLACIIEGQPYPINAIKGASGGTPCVAVD